MEYRHMKSDHNHHNFIPTMSYKKHVQCVQWWRITVISIGCLIAILSLISYLQYQQRKKIRAQTAWLEQRCSYRKMDFDTATPLFEKKQHLEKCLHHIHRYQLSVQEINDILAICKQFASMAAISSIHTTKQDIELLVTTNKPTIAHSICTELSHIPTIKNAHIVSGNMTNNNEFCYTIKGQKINS